MSGLKGMAAFKKNLTAAMERYTKALAVGIYSEASNIVADSVEAAPVDTGSLRRSHYVTEPKTQGSKVFVEFGCGGIATDYALRQHETHSTKSKFLQNAMNAAKSNARQNVTAIAAEAFKSGNTSTQQQSTGQGPIARDPNEGNR